MSDGMAPDAPPRSPQGVPIAVARRLDPAARAMAQRMLASHLETAPVTVLGQADASALVALRGRLAAVEGEIGVRVTYGHLLIKIVAQTLGGHPQLNATLVGDELQLLDEVNVGFAVALPDGNLIVPVVHRADRLDLFALARRAADLHERAARGKLQPAEVRRGTFTLTNVGVPNILWTTPIINTPQCAILGTGAIAAVPVVRDGVVVPGHMLPLSLSFDHRAVNGHPAALFMASVIQLIENPGALASGL